VICGGIRDDSVDVLEPKLLAVGGAVNTAPLAVIVWPGSNTTVKLCGTASAVVVRTPPNVLYKVSVPSVPKTVPITAKGRGKLSNND
jgi:hypothetical protein